jgi:hypothetical protein
MRKSILAIALSLVVTSTHAQSWYQIAETTDQKYTIEIDIDTIKVGPYSTEKPDDGLYVLGISRYVSNGKEITKLASAVDVEECLSKTTGSIRTEWPSGNTKMEKWHKDGETGVDRRAKFLCDFINGKVQGLVKPKTKPEPKKIWM